ncbi:TetR/AcrR family transcriptional regulator [Pseudolysinimonas kribbensis]|uniref:TetR family transcriptional regulator n=1 Tax=Pseudolysinimonas kribbensis TaxID=433641 RepID=A0ABQ6K1H0_9MICO|nr:TetR/AcrR family transcriptional regulator [Pseudolysinimonas kribbensis]GMA94452.1 TetR family transcriptional regulator [Pseudolysinimonas kribbensis]
MPRSGAEARARLREAALELYRERGYDATTTAQIARRAGVTERTYFRHFADKREVLFDGETELREVLTGAVAGAPGDASPLELVVGAYVAAVPLFVAGREIALRRAELIATAPALQERAHAKSAALADAVVAALVARGVPEGTARLAARVGAAAFERASRDWYPQPERDLAALIRSAADEVRAL